MVKLAINEIGFNNENPIKFNWKIYEKNLWRKFIDYVMDHCFWTEVSVCHSSLCGPALAISVL